MTVNTTNSKQGKVYPVNKEVITTSQEKTRSWEEMCNEVSLKWMASFNQCEILKKFCTEYLETMEGFFDTNPDSLSYEHKAEYVECAQFMEDRYGRINNRIKEIKATL